MINIEDEIEKAIDDISIELYGYNTSEDIKIYIWDNIKLTDIYSNSEMINNMKLIISGFYKEFFKKNSINIFKIGSTEDLGSLLVCIPDLIDNEYISIYIDEYGTLSSVNFPSIILFNKEDDMPEMTKSFLFLKDSYVTNEKCTEAYDEYKNFANINLF